MADIPDDLNRTVTRALHEQGIEMTPDEVRATRESAYATIRAKLRECGIPCPEGDMELLRWMKRLMTTKGDT